MADRSIIIIGAGIAGLSAGCYAQMNGYDTRIFEMHHKAGGLCTYWKRRDYTIGTPGWLMGSGPANNDYHQFWSELGVLHGLRLIDYTQYARFEGPDGKSFILYTDIDQLERHMLELAPEDSDLIASFAKALHGFTRFKMPMTKPPELAGRLDGLKMLLRMLPHMGTMRQWMGMSLRDFAAKFKNPFMRQVWAEGVPVVFFDADVSIMFVMSTLALMHLKASGYLVGGPAEFVGAMERRYRDLGGEIHYRSRVTEILTEPSPSGEGDRAAGVRLEDGSEHRADVVVSAADGRSTIFDMLGARYVSQEAQGYYDSMELFPSVLFISLGVNRSFDGIPASAGGELYCLEEPLQVGGSELRWLPVHIYGFDPTLAPEGKTLVRVLFAADYGYWKELREDRERYRAEKELVADAVIALLDRYYPGIAAQIDMRDVATPVTFERYTGNWQGGMLGWLSTPATMNMRMEKTLPGLEGFYLIGQWVLNGSLPGAATSGRHVVQIICAEEGRPFSAPIG